VEHASAKVAEVMIDKMLPETHELQLYHGKSALTHLDSH
jgi:hypothetical protein